MQAVTLRDTRTIKVTGKQAGLVLVAPAGFVAVRITTGSLRSCARFDPPTVRTDVPGLFRARGAPASALVDCSDETLTAGSPPTTLVTTTTMAGTCGDGVVDQPSEACDGSDVGGCAGPLPGIEFSCRPPGITNECTCCLDGGIGTGAVGCCNPSAVLVPAGLYENAYCIATRCDPPFPCSGTDTCLPDGSCCTSLGAVCGTTLLPPGAFYANACCPGLACAHPGEFGLECCIVDGGACTTAADCCSGTCDAVTSTCAP